MGHLTDQQRYEFSVMLRKSGLDTERRRANSTNSTLPPPYSEYHGNLNSPIDPFSSSSSSSSSPHTTPKKKKKKNKRSKALYLTSRHSHNPHAPLCTFHAPLNTNLLLSLNSRLDELLLPPPSTSVHATLTPNFLPHLTHISTRFYCPGILCPGCTLSGVITNLHTLYILRVAAYVRKSSGGRIAPWLELWISLGELGERLGWECAEDVGKELRSSECSSLATADSSSQEWVCEITTDAGARRVAATIRRALKDVGKIEKMGERREAPVEMEGDTIWPGGGKMGMVMMELPVEPGFEVIELEGEAPGVGAGIYELSTGEKEGEKGWKGWWRSVR